MCVVSVVCGCVCWGGGELGAYDACMLCVCVWMCALREGVNGGIRYVCVVYVSVNSY